MPSPLITSIQQRCAECLGLLGALDPAKVTPQLPLPPSIMGRNAGFLQELVTGHLVRVLGSSSNIRCSEFAEYALQQLLQHYTAPKLLLLDSQQVSA